MLKLKKNELKKMDSKLLKENLRELEKELIKLNTQISTGTMLESPGRVRAVKRTIAKINTFIHQKKGGVTEKA